MFLDQIEKLTDVLYFLIEQISFDEAADLDKTLLSSCSTKLSDLVRNLDIAQSDISDSTLSINYLPSEDQTHKQEAEGEEYEEDLEDEDDVKDITENDENEDNFNEDHKNHPPESISLKTPVKIKIKIKNEKKEGSIYRCMMCEEDYEELDDLENHDLVHHVVDGKFRCKEDCDFITEEKKHLVEHFAVVHQELDVFKCPDCQEMFFEMKDLGIHLLTYHGVDIPKQTCPICRISFACPKKYNSHCRFEHRSARNCEYCNQVYRSKAHLNNHIRFVHKKSTFTCQICGDKIRSEKLFEIHMMKHRNAEKTVQCTVCDKYFYTAHQLKTHSRSHSDDRHLCSQCDYTSASRDTLKRHLKTVHSDVRNFTCGTCGMSFKTLDSLKGHSFTHTEIRNFECDICAKKFKKNIHLKIHKRIHTATYAGSCQLCGKHFVQMNNFKNHMLKHHSD